MSSPIKYCYKSTLQFSSINGGLDFMTQQSIIRYIKCHTKRDCTYYIDQNNSSEIIIEVNLQPEDLNDTTQISKVIIQCVVVHNLFAYFTYSEEEIICRIDGDISTLLPVKSALLTLSFLNPTSLSGIEQLIGPATKSIRLHQMNLITDSILGLYKFVQKRDGHVLLSADQFADIPAWMFLLRQSFTENYSIAKFQTELLKNGLKQFALR